MLSLWGLRSAVEWWRGASLLPARWSSAVSPMSPTSVKEPFICPPNPKLSSPCHWTVNTQAPAGQHIRVNDITRSPSEKERDHHVCPTLKHLFSHTFRVHETHGSLQIFSYQSSSLYHGAWLSSYTQIRDLLGERRAVWSRCEKQGRHGPYEYVTHVTTNKNDLWHGSTPWWG